jgi:hypothetical protein
MSRVLGVYFLFFHFISFQFILLFPIIYLYSLPQIANNKNTLTTRRVTKMPHLPDAQELLTADPSPQLSGYCNKKSRSLVRQCFPCMECCYPLWKTRYLILYGNYLFRYANEYGTKPKGVPLALDVSTLKNGESTSTFLIVQLDKTYTFRCESQEECKAWFIAISDRKSQAIREKLGHAPVSAAVQKANSAGLFLVKEKKKKEQVYDPARNHDVTMNPISFRI